ncbi:hypothetical protein SAMN06265370_12169 [Puniceibacterium sediminis]|uniref:DUF6471 domain-containing protein n=2 Tax=Puniceibacterium sediminis TaxID=1608407 RepID=A0A238YZG1_9RHOB|nr:hypothetical protein SAMN06265370_12169 [Puniceibacterium sediminis]
MKRKGVTYAQLVEKLAAIGISEKEVNVANKLSKGGVSNGVYVAMFKGYRDGTFAIGLTVGICLAILLPLLVSHGQQDVAYLPDAVDQSVNKPSQCGDGNEPVWGPWFGLCFGLHDSIAQWLMMAFTIIAAGLLYGTLLQANRTNIAAIKAADAAIEANLIMRHEQRPWITLERDFLCHFSDTGGFQGTIAWNYNLTNKGKTPAYAIASHGKILKSKDFFGILGEAEEFTENCLLKHGAGSVPIIFPGERTDNVKYRGFTTSAYDITSNADGRIEKKVVDGKKVSFLFCITYRTGLAKDSPIGVETRSFQIEERRGFFGPWQHQMFELSAFRIVR